MDLIAGRASTTVLLSVAYPAAKPSSLAGPTVAATGPMSTQPAAPSAYAHALFGDRAPFDAASTDHVSVYELASPAPARGRADALL